MTPLRKRVMRALVLALMTLALTANVAAADEGGSGLDVVPYDPGLPSGSGVDVPYDPGLPSGSGVNVPYDPGLPGSDEAPPPSPEALPNSE